MRKNLFSHLNV